MAAISALNSVIASGADVHIPEWLQTAFIDAFIIAIPVIVIQFFIRFFACSSLKGATSYESY